MGKRKFFAAIAGITVFGLFGCANRAHIPIVPAVDVERFMGDWYVIGHIPPFLTDEAFNAVERYKLTPEGKIDTVYQYNDGGFEAERKTVNSTAFVTDDPSNAVWKIQFVWPIKLDYRISYLDPDYQVTIIGRERRDYVWLLSRTPNLPAAQLKQLEKQIEDFGYDMANWRLVPQRWQTLEEPITQ